MTKKIILSHMQKQTKTKSPQNKKKLIQDQKKLLKDQKPKKNKNEPYKDMIDQSKELQSLNKKLLGLSIHQQSQTQPQVPKHKKSSPKNKVIKKSAQKKQVKKSGQKKQVKKSGQKKQVKKSVQKKQSKKVQQINPLYAQYLKMMESMCKAHTDKQSIKKLNIGFESFAKIRAILKFKSSEKGKDYEQIKKQIFILSKQPLKKIKYVAQITVVLERLKPNQWLNDEVINSYIELIEFDVLKKSEQTEKKQQYTIHILKTYFATLKNIQDSIKREIQKKGLTNKSLVIVPIHIINHWFLVIIFQQKIFIFDSLQSRSSAKSYFKFQQIKRCAKLFEKLYGNKQFELKDLVVIKDFPQQNNDYDCGMMMLCGIKNVISRFMKYKSQQNGIKRFQAKLQTKDFWTFCIQDMKYLRIYFAKQFMQEKIFLDF